MPNFMLLLHKDPNATMTLSPNDMQALIQKYNDWRARVAVGGHKLTDDGGKQLQTVGGKVSVRDGPYAEAKEIVAGYFMIEAADYADAVRKSEDCPHLAFGGKIELRQVDVV